MLKNKILLGVFVLVLLSPFVYSRIDIQIEQSQYNLGDGIGVDISILREEDTNGLLKMELDCTNYKLPFYLTPISLEKNFRSSIKVPGFKATEEMIGGCSVLSYLLEGNSLIEHKESVKFEVTDEFSIKPSQEMITALPGDSITLTGRIFGAYGNGVSDALIETSFEGQRYSAKSINGEYNIPIKVSSSVKSGRHDINFTASDKNKNKGMSGIYADITPLATTLSISAVNETMNSGDTAIITPVLLDQYGDELNKTAVIEIKSPEKKKIMKKEAVSNNEIYYQIGQYDAPGQYVLEIYYEDLKDSYSFTVLRKREIKLTYGNESVIIENIGNVVYDGPLEFIAKGKEKEHLIRKKVSLEPGESTEIAINSEVSGGVYDILLADNNNSSILLENDGVGDNLIASEKEISDHRPFYKKVTSGLGSITASVIGADGILVRNPLAAPITLISIVLLFTLYYSRKRIKNIFRRKKSGQEDYHQKPLS